MDGLTLGERISLIRRRRGMTQRDLGALVGIQQSDIHRLEVGLVQDPHVSRLRALAQALHVTSDWLLGLDMQEEQGG